MLSRVTAKHYHQMKVTDVDGLQHDMKLQNVPANGVQWRVDHDGTTDIDSLLEPGNTVQTPTGQWLIIGDVTPNFHRGTLIRHELGLILCNNLVTISRPVPVTTRQGGHRGYNETPVYSGVHCKTGPVKSRREADLDQNEEEFGMLCSREMDIQLGDHLTFSELYKPAKVTGVIWPNRGLVEVRFSEEPRG